MHDASGKAVADKEEAASQELWDAAVEMSDGLFIKREFHRVIIEKQDPEKITTHAPTRTTQQRSFWPYATCIKFLHKPDSQCKHVQAI